MVNIHYMTATNQRETSNNHPDEDGKGIENKDCYFWENGKGGKEGGVSV